MMTSTPKDLKKTLFFIKSPTHNLKSIEAFLNKRNFAVHSEYDLKEALSKVMELQPDFVFLAWDHNDSRASSLPKLISQACAATLVIYIMTNTKEAIRKLNICAYNPKLYPPVSGPAIERLVLRSGKMATVGGANQIIQSKAKPKSKEELVKIRTSLMADLESEQHNPEETQSESHPEKERSASIERRNDIISTMKTSNLSADTVEGFKHSLQEKVVLPLENLLSSLQESAEHLGAVSVIDDPTPAPPGQVIVQQGVENPDGLGTTIQKGFGNSTLGMTIQKGFENPQGLGLIIQKGTESGQGVGTVFHQLRRAYCLSIFSENWCGYLIMVTDVVLDFSAVDLVFYEWIKQQFPQVDEIDEHDFFEIGADDEFVTHLTRKADYFETVSLRGSELGISFFSVEPAKMRLNLNEEKNLIQIATEDIPTGTELSFSLQLHLPQNKKYLLYTQAHKALNSDQKQRLLTNKVDLLYTSLDFEKEYKRFVAEKIVRDQTKKLYSV